LERGGVLSGIIKKKRKDRARRAAEKEHLRANDGDAAGESDFIEDN